MTPFKFAIFLFTLIATRAIAAAQSPATIEQAHVTPWNLSELSKPPKFDWVSRDGAVHSLFYQGEPYRGRPTRVFAYYASPATLNKAASGPQKYPAVVLVHGGGGTAFREWCELWAKRGYAAIAMDLAGHRPIEGLNPHQPKNRKRLADGGPDQGDADKFEAIDKPLSDQWPYQAIASVVRAHSLIRSFPEVDADHTAVTGISWGGYLTCIVAGVDPRFKAAVPVYGCGFLHENSAWLPRLTKMPASQRDRWIKLWDPSRFLAHVSMPILFVNGTNDFAYPLDSYMKSIDAVPGTKQIRITINMPHGHPPGWAPREIGLFIDHYLRGGEGLPEVKEVKNDDGRLSVTFHSPTKLVRALLNFTTANGPINKRSWQTASLTLDDNRVAWGAARSDATAWFVTLTDDRGAIVSSRVYFDKH